MTELLGCKKMLNFTIFIKQRNNFKSSVLKFWQLIIAVTILKIMQQLQLLDLNQRRKLVPNPNYIKIFFGKILYHSGCHALNFSSNVLIFLTFVFNVVFLKSFDMQNKPLHIVAFDNPFPANYGGAIDVFYKIKALYELGFDIYLHCFITSNDEVASELKKLTRAVYLYQKNRNPFFLFSSFPFSVKSRFQKDLLTNIKTVDAPVLFEGLQSTMVLHNQDFGNRKLFLRLHNLENHYYNGLASSETNWLKKRLYQLEAKKYEHYLEILNRFKTVFTLSILETEAVNKLANNAQYIPVFHGNTTLKDMSEFGNYGFYHGDLRLADNKKAASFLIECFKEISDYSLIIASNNGKNYIENQIKNTPNISFATIDNDLHLAQLLHDAQINVMLSFQQSGTKLKLVNALFNSRFCLINKNMVDDERLLSLCEIATSKTEFITKINTLKTKPFRNANRSDVLLEVLNDAENAKKMADFLN